MARGSSILLPTSVKEQSWMKGAEQSKGAVCLWSEAFPSAFQLYLAHCRDGNLHLHLCQPWPSCWRVHSCSLFPSSHHRRQKLSNTCINSLLPIYYPAEAELIKYQPQTANSFSMRGIVKNSPISFPCSTRRAKLETHQPEDIFSCNLHFNGRAEDLLLSARSRQSCAHSEGLANKCTDPYFSTFYGTVGKTAERAHLQPC